MNDIKLTQYSQGSGCGCKISSSVLTKILASSSPKKPCLSLLVGNESKDDAAVYKLQNGTCIVSTTDFFTPIVDDPFLYGAIASANAVSDIYAMGGTPLMAIAILGWPINTIPPQIASRVLEGSRAICQQINIPLGGGHSIDIADPIFGLAVTGILQQDHLKKNNTATLGSLLYLTKPLGTGIISTAQKKGKAHPNHMQEAIDTMIQLNTQGEKWGHLPYVNAMTDVTGFGLLGHLEEMCDGSNLSAEIAFDQIPHFHFLDEYLQQKTIPGGTFRNWTSYGHRVDIKNDRQKFILADPQTSGGLLVAVEATYAETFEKQNSTSKFPLKPFGKFVPRGDITITVK